MNIFIVHGSHHLTDHAAHGDGLIAWGFIKSLAERGHSVWVAAPRIDVLQRDLPRIKCYEIELKTRGTVARLCEYAFRSRLLYERLQRSGARFDIVHQFNPVVRGYSLGMLGVRVPLVLGPFNGDWPVFRTTKKSKTDLVKQRAKLFGRRFADVMLRFQARAFVITTPYALTRLPGLSLTSQCVHIVPNGIDEVAFGSATIADTGYARFSVLIVGNATHKGIYTMLAAFERVASDIPNAELVIAGGGPQSDDVKARIRSSRHRDRYRTIGSVSRGEMPGIIAAANVVCVPSFGEPFGMIVLEAMSAAKPVAGSRAGGIPYLLDATQEMLFEPGDDKALADILRRLAANPDAAERLGQINRARVVAEFTWASVSKKLESAYIAAVSGAR